MNIYLHNTLSGQKERFVPISPDRVTMYVCGPTVYNYVHIGNARPVVVFDTLYRLLKRHYPEVRYARNITDVDDKINKAASDNRETICELSSRYADAYRSDMQALFNLTPQFEPRATDNIGAMIEIITTLIEKGHAYEAEGHVLFNVSTDPHYGCLSKRNLDDMIAGARVEVAPYKKNPADFVLWKPSSDDLPGWDSPWGRGRPGWHIECTAMINAHLGKTIDIHAGGLDLVFPHHENEIAQGTCAHQDERYVNYWLHNGYLTIDGEKMSKSLGNFATVHELLQHWPGEVLRYALLSAHYRSPLDWSDDALTQARASLDRLYGALRGHTPSSCADTHATAPDALQHPLLDTLEQHLADDLATPQALAVLHQLAGEANRSSDTPSRTQLQAVLASAGERMGLLTQDPESWFKWQAPAARDATGNGLDDAAIEDLIQQRRDARKAKNFARSDEIRDLLKAQGIELEDTREGTRWTRG
ncbi:Cysteinyl-tRNA synthetase [gamma proteobacterium HdN1]|nr:Cysteinyl-tRNA synthetase [gamma proteobacterium HdN1]